MDLENSSNTVNTMTHNFTKYIADLKQNTLYMQDMISAGHKLQSTLKATSVAQSQFLESFRRVTDHSKNLYIGTGDCKNNVSNSLSKLITYEKALHQKQNNINSMLSDCVLQPIGTKSIEEWKKNNLQLERENVKEFKKLSSEIKKMQAETVKLQKKVHKKTDVTNNSEAAALQVALQDVSQRVAKLERSSRNAMNACYREQAARFLTLITAFSPILETQISTQNEVTNIRQVSNDLASYKEQLTGLVSGSLDSAGQNPKRGERENHQLHSTHNDNSKPELQPKQTPSKIQIQNQNLPQKIDPKITGTGNTTLSTNLQNLRIRNSSVGSSSQTSSSTNTTSKGNFMHIPSSYGHGTSAYNLAELTGAQNSSCKIPSISSRDSGFLSQIYSQEAMCQEDTCSSNSGPSSNGPGSSAHGAQNALTALQSATASRTSVADSQTSSNLPMPLPPPPTDWIADEDDLPVPPPPGPKTGNIFPSSMTGVASSPTKVGMKPPALPAKPRSGRMHSGMSSISGASVPGTPKSGRNLSNLNINSSHRPTIGGPVSPPIPTVPLTNSRYANVHKSLPPTPNHGNIQMRKPIVKNSSVTSASMVNPGGLNAGLKSLAPAANMENGTATIRRRASARIPPSMNFF